MPGNTMKDVRDIQARADAVGKDMTSGCLHFFKVMVGFMILLFAIFTLFMVLSMS